MMIISDIQVNKFKWKQSDRHNASVVETNEQWSKKMHIELITYRVVFNVVIYIRIEARINVIIFEHW